MKRLTHYTARITIVLAILHSISVSAADKETNSLDVQLRQRDQVILELLERVRALEQQSGIVPARNRIDKHQETAEDAQKPVKTSTSPGLVIVDESMAERALERSLTRAGAVLLPSGKLEFEPRLAYVRQEDSTPSFVNTSSGVTASQTEINSDSFTASIIFRYGLPGDAQIEVGIPYRWRRSQTLTRVNFSPVSSTEKTGSGQGDVQIGLAKTLAGRHDSSSNLIGSLSWNTGNGMRTDHGVSLGAGYPSIQASLSFSHRNDPLVVVSSVSYQHSIENDRIQPGAIMSGSVASYLALNPRTAMNLSLSLAYQQETRVAGSSQTGSARTVGILQLGGSTLVGRGTLFNLSLGIGLTRDASNFSVMASLPVRF